MGEDEKAVDQQASNEDTAIQVPQNTSSMYKSSGNSKTKSKMKRKLVAAIGPAAGLLILVLIIFMLMSLLKIPNYAANIAAYRMASSALDYASTSAEIDAEKIALSELDAKAWKTAIYDKFSTMRSSTWGKFDKYRPAVMYKNLNAAGDIVINDVEEKIPVFGGSVTRTKITSIDVYGKNFEIPKTSRILHPAQSFTERVNFARNIRGAIDGGLKSSNSLVRSSVASQIREAAGIKLYWWEEAGAKFKGLNADEADIQEIRDSVSRISETPTPTPIVYYYIWLVS